MRDEIRAQRHLGLAALHIAARLVIAFTRRLQGLGIGPELLNRQQPEVLVRHWLGLGIPLHQPLCVAATLHIAERGVCHLLHFLQQLAQFTRRQRFLPAPQGGIQTLRQRALLGIDLVTLCTAHPQLGLFNPVCCPTHL